MLKKIRNLNSEGFTIIEVMIVLAIAALILLIVLLAVPALQRNSRNTAIKNDASAIVAAVGYFSSNNDCATPTGAATAGSSVTISGGAGTTSSTAKVQSNTTVTASGTPTGPGQVVVLFGQKCNAANGFATTASPRSSAVLYDIETSGGTAPRCTDS
jgi:prepilin-type N-terminal cleavage/methylation domain-containing protein